MHAVHYDEDRENKAGKRKGNVRAYTYMYTQPSACMCSKGYSTWSACKLGSNLLHAGGKGGREEGGSKCKLRRDIHKKRTG